MINPLIFKSYDVRGIYPSEINEEAAEIVGRAAVQHLKAKKIVVGRDVRLSSPALHRALLKGITEAGADVVDIGIVPSSVTYFTVASQKLDAGMYISASHNPPEYNGIKIVKQKGIQLSKDTGIEDIKTIAVAGEFKNAKKIGKVKKLDIRPAYYKHVLKFARGMKPGLEVIIDAGNGVGGMFGKPVFDKLPIKYKPLYFKPDGKYPNHLANPAEEKNLQDVVREIKKIKNQNKVGIAFDGDADRAFFVDDKGKTLRPDYYTALIAPEQLKNNKDKRIYYDLRYSKAVLQVLKKYGAKPVKTRVGNPFYKIGLIEKGGAMAAELSGHVMFPESYGLDDGIIATVKMLNFLSRQKEPLSKLIEPIQGYYANPGEINVESKNSAKVIEGLEKKYGKLGKVEKLDGLTVEMKDWWFNVRGSNTEPVIRVNLETRPDKKYMLEKKQELLSEIKKLDR